MNSLLKLILLGSFGLLAGCVVSYSSVRPSEQTQLLSGPEGDKLKQAMPYPEAEGKEKLVTFYLEIPGFPEWRRYYWTDKSLWGNRGYVTGEKETQLVVDPELAPVFEQFQDVFDDLGQKLKEVQRTMDTDEVVIIEAPVYDQRRAFEEARLAGEQGVKVTHVVRKGESLWLIAGYPEIYGNPLEWPKIFEANRDRVLDPNLIYPDQKLKIPRSFQDLKGTP